MTSAPLSRHHRMRLMQIWRSAGWPCQDAVEIELLTAGLVQKISTPQGHEQLRLTEVALGLLAQARQQGLRAASLHDRIEHRFAQQQLLPAGRIVWRELALRAAMDAEQQPPPEAQVMSQTPQPDDLFWADETQVSPALARKSRRVWRVARPDLFSIRNTSVPAYLQPVVHEVKASRADLLSDLRHAAKRQAYQWLSEECYYVFPAGIAEPEELPEEYGVWVMHGDVDAVQAPPRFELLRPARHVRCSLPFAVWMALCKATPLRRDENEPSAQKHLGALLDGDEPQPDTDSLG